MNWKGEPPLSGPLLETYGGEGSEFLRFEVFGMGTHNVLLLRGPDEAALRRAAHEAMQILDRLEQRLSKFLPDSDVSLANALAARSAVPVGEDLFTLLVKAREAWQVTGGVFDPTVAPLLAAWGFVDRYGRVPAADELARLRAAQGMDLVELDDAARTVKFARPGVAIDLGGIGKGYAADCMAKYLLQNGAEAGAVICGRSSVVTWGAPSGDTEWSFEIVDPTRPTETLLTLSAAPGAVSSSGAYERRWRLGTNEFGHVFDPRTGKPAATTIKGATVWTESALLGDVLSTVLFVLGEATFQSEGCVERLARMWTSDGKRTLEGASSRVGIVLVKEDPGAWGGVSVVRHSLGQPPFRDA